MAKADRAEAAAKLRALSFHKGRADAVGATATETTGAATQIPAVDAPTSPTTGDGPQPPSRNPSRDDRHALGAASPSPAPSATPRHPASQHPATPVRRDRTPRRDIVDIDPARILEAGPYIREWDEEGDEFERLCATIRERGQIDTPIWVRSRGGAGNREMVLVAGKGRLHAALAVGLPAVPVRDYGELDDAEAIALQVQENLNRQDMTPGETAQALWLLGQHGTSISDIARAIGRDKGYVSVMARTGEALATLTAVERAGLSRRGMLQVRECQAVAAAGSVPARAEELRRILASGGRTAAAGRSRANRTQALSVADGQQSAVEAAQARRSANDDAPVVARELRNGRSFRVRWDRAQLARDPGAFASSVVDAVRHEMAALAAALYQLEAESRQASGAPSADDSATVSPEVAEGFRAARALVERFARQAEGRGQ